MEEKSKNEERVRAITKIYYSNPKVQERLVDFSKDREVVPRYFEGFGKRPDMVQYPSDIMAMVHKGATSFHASEELWIDPLKLDSNMTIEEMKNLRKSWDLLIDIDSPYFDISKEAAKLVIEFLERKGINNYGLKFSGNKGFHIIVTGKAFPREYDEKLMKESFPEWPRAITEYIFSQIKPDFRRKVGEKMSFSSLEKKGEEKSRIVCKQCHSIALKGDLTKLKCPVCNLEIERRDYKLTKRRLRCLNKICAGVLEVIESEDYYYCENCKDPNHEKLKLSSNKYPEFFEELRGELADEHAELDLVLVAPRHLFRMPYSLHEKTSLSSVVLKKEELDNFSLKDASALGVKFRNFLPENEENEAKRLLLEALAWKKTQIREEESATEQRYKNTTYEKVDFGNVSEAMFPRSINNILKGLKDGKKRGLFVLITFFRTVGFSPDYINNKIHEWNKKNENPLKEGYLKGQIDWHLKQKKQILPPNYSNDNFYKDLGVLDYKPDVKNPIVEVMRKLKRN